MRRRSKSYEKKDDVDELVALATRLTDDLHSQLHLITAAPVLSQEWVAMSGFCGRVAKISQAEAGITDRGGTMWEGEELALRFLMEEGKLNLCLRNLVEAREYVQQSGNKLDDDSARLLDAFEKGMGLLLRNAWQHVEAIQTTDLPVLVRYIGRVLAKPNMEHPEDVHLRQESLVLHYLHGLCTCIDEISQLGFIALLRNEQVVAKLVDFLDKHYDKLRLSDLLVAIQSLSYVIDSEDFLSREDQHMTPHTANLLSESRHKFIDRLFTGDYQSRKSIQPLLRYIQDISYK